MNAQPQQIVRLDSGIYVSLETASKLAEQPESIEEKAAAAGREFQKSGRTVVMNEHGGRTSTPLAKPTVAKRDGRPKCRVCRKGRLEVSDDPMPDDQYGERKPNAQNLRCTSCRQLVRLTASPKKTAAEPTSFTLLWRKRREQRVDAEVMATSA